MVEVSYVNILIQIPEKYYGSGSRKMMWILWIRIRNNERLGRWVYEKGQTYGRS